MQETIKKFKTNQHYATSSVCDHNCIFKFKVVRRTAKTIWVDGMYGVQSRRVYVYDGAESIKPFGTYSMAPILTANDKES